MTDQNVIDHFRDTGALLEGHFVLRSGMHSRQFFQCALALQFMPDVERLGAALADRVRSLDSETVVAPAMGGLVIGQEVARRLGTRFLFADKIDGQLALRRGFKIAAGERCLVVEDVITKGGRVRETLELIRSRGGQPVGVAVIVNRSGSQDFELDVPLMQLARVEVDNFAVDEIPADLAHIPAVKPGS